MAQLILKDLVSGQPLRWREMHPSERYAYFRAQGEQIMYEGLCMAGFSLHRDEGSDGQPEGIWSPYGPELTDAEQKAGIKREGYLIRPLSPKNMDHFRKLATKKIWRRNQQEDELDQERYNEALYDYLVVDWQGVYLDEAKTAEAPCTLEHKLLLASMSLDRANFIILQASLYANDDEARKTAQRDNFRQARAVPAGSTESQL
jgi:hypothetical protein